MTEAQKSQPQPPTPTTKKAVGPNFAGTYRVREGFRVAHGTRATDDPLIVGRHGEAAAGDEIELNHLDALSVIKLTAKARDPKSGALIGPAIETVEAYRARVTAEAEQAALLAQLTSAE